ncbi:MAG: hypothetical protein ABGW90_14690 [Martelella sp.]
MTLGINYAKKIREDARLIILKALAEQLNDTLASNVITETVLPVFGVRQTREWVHQQLDFLANLDAIDVVEAGTVKVATLQLVGKQHLERMIALEGVSRPSLKGGE